MKKLTLLIAVHLVLFASVLCSSCALYEFDEEQIPAVDMRLGHDSIYVEVGDYFKITPIFDPDTISIDDVYWASDDPQIVYVLDNAFAAISEGWVTIHAISVSHQRQDSCRVCVVPRWSDIHLPVAPYETVIYASPRIADQDFDPQSMVLVAYLGYEVCGFGQLCEQNGHQYIVVRVGSEIFDHEDYLDVTIRLKLYNRRTRTFRDLSCSEFLPFDTESHGTPLAPLTLRYR